jgi:hypothetical protein
MGANCEVRGYVICFISLLIHLLASDISQNFVLVLNIFLSISRQAVLVASGSSAYAISISKLAASLQNGRIN